MEKEAHLCWLPPPGEPAPSLRLPERRPPGPSITSSSPLVTSSTLSLGVAAASAEEEGGAMSQSPRVKSVGAWPCCTARSCRHLCAQMRRGLAEAARLKVPPRCDARCDADGPGDCAEECATAAVGDSAAESDMLPAGPLLRTHGSASASAAVQRFRGAASTILRRNSFASWEMWDHDELVSCGAWGKSEGLMGQENGEVSGGAVSGCGGTGGREAGRVGCAAWLATGRGEEQGRRRQQEAQRTTTWRGFQLRMFRQMRS